MNWRSRKIIIDASSCDRIEIYGEIGSREHVAHSYRIGATLLDAVLMGALTVGVAYADCVALTLDNQLLLTWAFAITAALLLLLKSEWFRQAIWDFIDLVDIYWIIFAYREAYVCVVRDGLELRGLWVVGWRHGIRHSVLKKSLDAARELI